MHNIIIKGSQNAVVIVFTFTGDFAASGLNTFTRIAVDIGGESYSTDTSAVTIQSNTELRINIGELTTLENGYYDLTIKGFNATYLNGFTLTSQCKPLLSPVKIC